MKSGTHQQPTTFQSRPQSVQVQEFQSGDIQPIRPMQTPPIGSRPPSANKKQLLKRKAQLPAKLGLVHALSDENGCLEGQRKKLQEQMGKLRKITENLLSDNKQLREVYRERTSDIPKLMSSLSLNASESTEDYQHQCFLLRELNCALFKQIKSLDQQRSRLGQEVETRTLNCQQANQERVVMEQQFLGNVKVRIAGLRGQKSRLSQVDRIDEIEIELEKLTTELHELEGGLNALIAENSELRRGIAKGQMVREQADNIAQQKTNYLLNMVYLQGEVKQYQDELEKDRLVDSKAKELCQQQAEQYSTSVQALARQIRQYEVAQRRQQEMVAEIASVRSALAATEQSVEVKREEHQKKADERAQLKKEVKSIKERLRTFQAGRSDKSAALRVAVKENIKSISNHTEKNHRAGEEELKKIREEKVGLEERVTRGEEEHICLTENVEEYYKVLQQFSNPKTEVEKLEMLLRVKKIR